MPTSIDKATRIVNDHVEGRENNDNQLKAAIGLLSEYSNQKLIWVIDALKDGIAKTGKDVMGGLDRQVEKIIHSNQSLSASNDRHSVAMKWLTIALVIIGFLQVLLTFFQYKAAISATDAQREGYVLEREKFEYQKMELEILRTNGVVDSK